MMLINQSDFPSTRWTGIPWFRQVLCKALFILGPEFQVSLRVPHQSTVISGPRGSESVSFVRLFVCSFVCLETNRISGKSSVSEERGRHL